MQIRYRIENKLLIWIRKIPVSHQTQVRLLFVVCWLLPIYSLKWFLRRLFIGKFASVTIPSDSRTRSLSFSLCGEGIGGQFSRYVTGRQMAEILNLRFVHCPLERNFHCPEIDWDDFLGFADLHQNSLAVADSIKTVYLPEFDLTTNRTLQLFLLKLITQGIYWQDHVHFVLSWWSWAPPEASPEFSTALFNPLRSNYRTKRLTDPLPVFRDQNKVRVAVIIRRGEIAQFRTSEIAEQRLVASWRWVETDWYLKVLQILYRQLGDADIECHIFSDVSDTHQLDPLLIFPGVTLHLKDEPRQPLLLFNAIVESDISVCGLTGICYAAGVLGNGTMILPRNDAQAVYFPRGERWIEIHGLTGGEQDRLYKALNVLKAQKCLRAQYI